MNGNGLRVLPFEILSGLTEVKDTPRRPPNGSGGLKHYHRCDVAVNLPPALQSSEHHPSLVKWWLEDWGKFVGGCSEGNFAEALVKGTNLGHAFAETIRRIIDSISMGVGSGFVEIGDMSEPRDEAEAKDTDTRVVYRIWVFYEKPLRFSVAGAENLTTGYLNDIILDERRINIHAAIRGMVDYRLDKPRNGSSRRPRRARKRPGRRKLAATRGR